MNITEAFNYLDSILLESAATDEFRQLSKEIDQLDKEIKTIQNQKTKSWDHKYTRKYELVALELTQLKQELKDLEKSYKEFSHTEREDDGDRYYYFDVFVDNPEKKAAVAAQEKALEKKLKELEIEYNKIVAELRAEYEKDFRSYSKAMSDKAAIVANKKNAKNNLFKAIIAEERAELEQLINKVNKYTKVNANISNITLHNGKLFLGLTSKTKEIEIDLWDDVDYEDNYASVNTDKLVTIAEEHALEDGFLFDVAYSLGIDEERLDQIDFTFSSSGNTVDIPNSSWKLSTDCDMSHNKPHVSVHYNEVDVEENFEYTITCYLVKEI